MPLTIVRNDITKMQVDAIVNAANSRLKAGGGVCGAIFKAAGAERLQAACDKIGYCNTGMAIITKGFDLPSKYVIHTVGPIYEESNKKQETELYNCYYNSLMLARKKNLSSVAFALISSGIYGYPRAEALGIARKAITDFLDKYDMDVYLVVYDKASFEIGNKLFSSIKSYIDENMVLPPMKQNRCFEVYEVSRSDEWCDTVATVAFSEESRKMAPSRSLEELIDNIDETFSQMLLRLIDKRGLKDSQVYKKANIDRKLFSKIRNDKHYKPKKSTVLSFAIALCLSLDETNDLLGKAGYAMTHSSKADIIIEYFIKNNQYDIFEINETLFYFEQPPLSV